jgi:DNA-nicking Smr family endonuclease
MSRKRSLSDDERVLWRAVTRAVVPLRGRKADRDDDATSALAPPVKPRPVQAQGSPAMLASPRPASAPPLSPIDRRMKQKLARGTTGIDGRIDLHGLTQAEAHGALARFLRQAQARDARVVLVITGKGGFAGEGRGVLRRQVPLWLEGAQFRALVIGFDAAGVGHGGEGALYVRVRRGGKS